MSLIEIVLVAFWAMLPAYVPNNVAVLAGGGRPIDAGRTWGGRRILGDGKTWRGTIAGVAAGALLAIALNAIVDPVSSGLGVELPAFALAAAVTLPAGAMLGDILASFLKRRTGRERGAAFPGLDQLDFVVGAIVLTAIGATDWFGEVFTLPVVVAVFVLTPVFHLGTNVIAYRLGFKNEPW